MKADDPALTGSLKQDAMIGETGSPRDRDTGNTSFLTSSTHSRVRQRTANQRELHGETEAPGTQGVRREDFLPGFSAVDRV